MDKDRKREALVSYQRKASQRDDFHHHIRWTFSLRSVRTTVVHDAYSLPRNGKKGAVLSLLASIGLVDKKYQKHDIAKCI